MAICYSVQLSDTIKENRWAAEFHRPGYKFVAKNPDDWKKIGRCSKLCQYGLSIKMNETGRGVPIYRLNEIEGCFLSESPTKYAPITPTVSVDFEIEKGDLLFCRTNGNINYVGRTGLFLGSNKAVFASYLVRVRTEPSLLLPEYLAIYLNSEFGRRQIVRRAMQSNQVNVSAAELKRIDAFLAPAVVQEEVAQLVQHAYSARILSLASYVEAQVLLEAELGLDSMMFQKPMGYIAQLSDMEAAHRSDAQHYQPRFKQLIDHISGFPSARVRDIRSVNRRGLQPIYVRDGQIDVVNSKHLGPKHIDYEGLAKTSANAFTAASEAHIRRDDVLIYTTGAYIGRTNVYLSDSPAMASNHVNIVRLETSIDAAYMALVFQSIVGQFQTQQHARGSAQAELYPSDIDRFVVPLLGADKQRVIGDLVRESLVKQQASRKLLEQAKTRVEQLIEEAVQS